MSKLVKCKDCGHEISKQAKSCPQCGAPQKRKTSGCAWIALVLLGLFLYALIKGGGASSRVTPPPATPKPTAAPAATPMPTATPAATPTPDLRNGRTEEERRAIFQAVVEAEDKGMHQAEKEFPFIVLSKENTDQYREQEMQQTEKRMARMNELNEQYRQEALAQHGVGEGELNAIEAEAFEKDWLAQITPAQATPEPTPDRNHAEAVTAQFSSWDGTHRNLVKYVKEHMNDPKSFEHVETKYVDKGELLIIQMQFRGKNKFNATVLNTIYAEADMEGTILKTEMRD